MEPLKTYFPFGPPIGYAELPKELVNDLNKGCDDIVKDEELSKSSDYSYALVGQVEQELLISADIINKWGKWFITQVRAYVAGYFNQLYIPEQNIMPVTKEQALESLSRMQINVQSSWYIRSFAGDFNPIHQHTDCELTCVGFLKVPDLSNERKKSSEVTNRGSPAGALEILSSIGVTNSFFENDRIGFKPKVGNWYLFPANIRHAAYPFSCDGERRSFSMNINTNVLNK
jgi:hypothetical protein